MKVDLVEHETLEDVKREFDEEVELEYRRTNLKDQNQIWGVPTKRKVTVEIFDRNPKVVAIALKRANGVCEGCKEKAPFLCKTTLKPYLEVHHVVRLIDGGEDSPANTIALCPNCHRRAHYE